MERVVEHTIAWHYVGKPGEKRSVRYITAASDDRRELAKTVADSTLTQADLEAAEEYRRACEEGTAVIANMSRKKLQ